MGIFTSLWCERYRPATLDDIVLSDENKAFFEQIKKQQECPHLMLSGNPGIGKTTLAKIVVKDILDCQYLYINASDESGVDTIRSKVTNFAQTASIDGKIKVIILDEVDGLSSVTAGKGQTSAQQALRNVMEDFWTTTRFILTCNYPYKVIKALHSRCQSLDLTPPLDACVKRCAHVLKQEKVKVVNGEKKLLVDLIRSKYPDLRKMINTLQQNVIDGKLILKDTDVKCEIAVDIWNRLTKKKDILKIREYVIQNEVEFGNDYHQLLKDLYEVVYASKISFAKKRQVMMAIASAMYQHQFIMDAEINCFSCVLAISEVMGA